MCLEFILLKMKNKVTYMESLTLWPAQLLDTDKQPWEKTSREFCRNCRPSHTAGKRIWGRRRPVLLSITSGSAHITVNAMAMWHRARGAGEGQKSPPGTWESQTLGEKERSCVPEHRHSNMWGRATQEHLHTALTCIPNIPSKCDSSTAGLTMHGF